MVYNRFPIRWQRLIVSDAINNIIIYYDYFFRLAFLPNHPVCQRRRRRYENQLRCQSDNLLGPRRRTIQSNTRENSRS